MSGEQLAAIELEHRLAKAEQHIEEQNKTIVELAESLDFYKSTGTWEKYGTLALEDSGVTAYEALTKHAEAIKRARGMT